MKKRISIHVDNDDISAIKNIAEEEGCDAAEIYRHAIKWYLWMEANHSLITYKDAPFWKR